MHNRQKSAARIQIIGFEELRWKEETKVRRKNSGYVGVNVMQMVRTFLVIKA